MQWIDESTQAIQDVRPVGFELLIEKLLCRVGILNPGKAVFPAPILNASLIHLNGEPFTAVDVDLNIEWKPALDMGMHETKNRVHAVVVKV